MANAQTQFESFHKTILLDYDTSQALRDRRKTLLQDLKNNISDGAPTYTHFTQGSYALNRPCFNRCSMTVLDRMQPSL